MSIWHWKLGDIALATICKNVYAKVQVVKDQNGLFYDDKVLGVKSNEEGTTDIMEELCYYVEIIRTKRRLWLPYTSLHLAERSRPFYGIDKILPPKKNDTPTITRKRKIKQDHTVPLDVKLFNKEPDLNTTYDITHTPLKQGRYENAFKEFVRRLKEDLFDEFYLLLKREPERNRGSIDYIFNVDASTEDKFETTIKNYVTEKEIQHYLHQCWRYNFVHKQMDSKDKTENANSTTPTSQLITLHTNWCLVCGKMGQRLRECPTCPASFHLVCRREWLISILHRQNPPKRTQKPVTLVEKILSSTRTICTVNKEKENYELCPSCMWGPRVGYDDVVWHKLGSCSWWPARVLSPGDTPACLLGLSHAHNHWPLRYYGTLNYSWGKSERMCLFLPTHTAALDSRDPDLQQAVLDACDDYIAVYLT